MYYLNHRFWQPNWRIFLPLKVIFLICDLLRRILRAVRETIIVFFGGIWAPQLAFLQSLALAVGYTSANTVVSRNTENHWLFACNLPFVWLLILTFCVLLQRFSSFLFVLLVELTFSIDSSRLRLFSIRKQLTWCKDITYHNTHSKNKGMCTYSCIHIMGGKKKPQQFITKMGFGPPATSWPNCTTKNETHTRCLKINQKVSFYNIASEASHVYFQIKCILNCKCNFDVKIKMRHFWYFFFIERWKHYRPTDGRSIPQRQYLHNLQLNIDIHFVFAIARSYFH